MSRYKIQALNENHEVYVGYDNSLRSLFAAVHDLGLEQQAEEDPDSDVESLVLWVGANYDEIKSVDKLKEKIAAYAVLPPEMEAQLQADVEAGTSYVPSGVQKWAEKWSTKFMESNQ